jgi:hypothetical protein
VVVYRYLVDDDEKIMTPAGHILEYFNDSPPQASQKKKR